MLKPTRPIAFIVIAAACVALSSCSTTKTLNTDDVQTEIGKGLTEQVGGTFTVTCPQDPPAQKGYSFTCDVSDPSDGSSAVVTVTEDDDQGTFTWKVTSAGGASPAPSPSGS